MFLSIFIKIERNNSINDKKLNDELKTKLLLNNSITNIKYIKIIILHLWKFKMPILKAKKLIQIM
jgi:hypothetical protein